MAMLKRTISIGRTGGGLIYRSLSSGKSKSLNHVDTEGMFKGLEAINVPSTQAEALTGAITGGLESVMEKVKADIAKSEDYQSTRVAEEVRKLRADIDKMRADIATMQAERRYDDKPLRVYFRRKNNFNSLLEVDNDDMAAKRMNRDHLAKSDALANKDKGKRREEGVAGTAELALIGSYSELAKENKEDGDATEVERYQA